MFTAFPKAAFLFFFLLMLAMPSFAQNTKGDKPASSRESRFKSGDKKKKPLFGKRTRKADAGKGYRPRAQRKGGETAHKPVTPLRNTDPNAGSGQRVKISRTRVTSPRASRSARNVYPQRGKFVNNPSPRPQENNQRSVSNRTTLARLKRLQTSGPGPRKKFRIIPNSASGSYRPQKSINVMARYPRPKRKGEQAVTRDISGRRIRTKNYESPKPKIVKSVTQGRVISITARDKRTKTDERFGRFRNFSSGGQISSRSKSPRGQRISVSGRQRKVFPQSGPFVNNPATTPRTTQQPVSNRKTLQRLKQLETPKPRPKKKITVVPRSASRPFVARKSTNTWAQFPRPKRRGEKPYLRDIAGRKLRTKNYETPARPVVRPQFDPYQGRKRVGERPYKGPAAGTHVSATQKTGKAWKGDLSGRAIRSNRTPGLGKTPRGGANYQSRTRHGETRPGRAPLPVKAPGVGGMMKGYRGKSKGIGGIFFQQGETFRGSIKARRPAKGGGSRSGKFWNNKGYALSPKTPEREQGEGFGGNLKAKRPAKGGGTRSGRLWNNNGSAIAARRPGREQGELYAGSIKARRPAKGGGTRSGKLWNNNNNPIDNRIPERQQGELYSGNIKARRPAKGGGSVSGKLWNNKQTPVQSKIPPLRAREVNGYPGKWKRFSVQPGFVDQGEEYTGSIKAKKPAKGGGSVSGKLWNNKGNAIAVRTPDPDAAKAGTFQGNIKAKRPEKGGGSISGKLWNNKETPLTVRTPKDQAAAKSAGNYTGELKMSRFQKAYVRNKNASEDALKKKRPDKTTYLVDGLQVKVEKYDYIRNKSSNESALKVREPGKAFARATDYQGNIKMQKFTLFEKNRSLHPDAKFVKINKNNVAEEKDMLTNLKLWWSRLFRKNETQPDHLKEKIRKPRYDKGEQGLWYD